MGPEIVGTDPSFKHNLATSYMFNWFMFNSQSKVLRHITINPGLPSFCVVSLNRKEIIKFILVIAERLMLHSLGNITQRPGEAFLSGFSR